MSNNVVALGVTPGRNVVEFSPGATGTVEITIVNNENKEMEAAIYFESEEEIFSELKVSSNVLQFKSGEASKTVSYTYKLPSKLEPGLHQVNVVARELPKNLASAGQSVGATVAVVHQLQVQVPYPGKYVTADIKIAETGKTDSVNFIMPVNNLGTQKVVRAKGVIDIYGPTNEKIVTVQTNEISIDPGMRAELTGQWNENVNLGSYLVKATVVYDGEVSKEVEKIFSVGKAGLELIDIYVNDFSLGQIARFNILVNNNWNLKINELFAEMIVYNLNNEEVIRFKSATESIESLGKQELTAFWDTAGIKEGEYKLTLVLNHDGQTTEKDVKMIVSLNSINFDFTGLTGRAVGGTGNLQTGTLITVGITTIVLIVGALFFFRRKKKKSK